MTKMIFPAGPDPGAAKPRSTPRLPPASDPQGVVQRLGVVSHAIPLSSPCMVTMEKEESIIRHCILGRTLSSNTGDEALARRTTATIAKRRSRSHEAAVKELSNAAHSVEGIFYFNGNWTAKKSRRCPEFQSRDVNPRLHGAVLPSPCMPGHVRFGEADKQNTHKNAPEGISVTGTGTEPNVWTESGSVAVRASRQAALVGHRERERAEGGARSRSFRSRLTPPSRDPREDRVRLD
ncbi:hypothetical protein EYF80_047689 [Liparis tanakae]|uniref:Uncharacterized protein n=1 Tax=Liparis tanakae TaxID=230148 RepID=A0A4Z2FLL6_9TELE|nr:hypothetical protein EYF80_047689 [Liparis tanakae]